MTENNPVAVFLEPPGVLKPDKDKALLLEGRRIADGLKIGLAAIAMRSKDDERPLCEECGVDVLYRLNVVGSDGLGPEVLAAALRIFLQNTPFRTLLFYHSDLSKEVAPRVATGLHTVPVTGCTDIRVQRDSPIYVRLLYGGRYEQEIIYAFPGLELATLTPELLTEGALPESRHTNIVDVNLELIDDVPRTEYLELIPPDHRTVDIVHAKRIVGVGAGCIDPELLEMVKEMSSLLEGSIGATRPVVDDGYVPKERMIGQTGKAVAPDLYLALGISGSPHHIAGIQEAGEIVSVNRDPHAPIFGFSDVGYVADLKSVLPKLVDLMRRYRDEGTS